MRYSHRGGNDAHIASDAAKCKDVFRVHRLQLSLRHVCICLAQAWKDEKIVSATLLNQTALIASRARRSGEWELIIVNVYSDAHRVLRF